MSLSITARDLVTRTLQTIGAIGQGETPSAADINTGFQLLGELVDNWAIQALTVLTVNRQVYNLVAGQGGPDNPYTYGPGGDWDTGATVARPPSIQDANLLLATSGVSPIRIPLPILTTDMNAATPTPTLPNQLPVSLYYNATVPLGTAVLWPIPSTNVNQIELFVPLVTGAFPDLSTSVVCAPGYLKAFRLCLAESMIPLFAVPPAQAALIPSQAAEALAQLKISNVPMSDLSFDQMYTPPAHGTYVIQTDQGA